MNTQNYEKKLASTGFTAMHSGDLMRVLAYVSFAIAHTPYTIARMKQRCISPRRSEVLTGPKYVGVSRRIADTQAFGCQRILDLTIEFCMELAKHYLI